MPENPRTAGAAEMFLSGLREDRRVSDLLVLALERALVRDRTMFRLVGTRSAASRVVHGEERVDPAEWAVMVEPSVEDAVSHVADWLASALAEDAGWLGRTDRDGRPLKLMKIGSLDRAMREADKAMMRFSSAMAGAGPTVEGESVHRQLADGWTLVRMESPRALDVESGRMQHCIGQGAYDHALLSGSRILLSLRDPAGKPHATMEVEAATRRLLQLRGKQNKAPIPRYVRKLKDFLAAEVEADNRWAYATGIVVDVDGVVHDAFDLPPVLHAKGDLVLSGDAPLPTEILTVRNGFVMKAPGCSIRLPQRLVVGGDVVLEGEIDFAGVSLHGARSLKLDRCRVEGLPDGLKVDGDLGLVDSTIDRLPPGLRVKGKLVLGTGALPIPADASIGELVLTGDVSGILSDGTSIGTLTYKEAEIGTMPSGLRIGRLNFDKCGPVELPVDLSVRESLSVKDCMDGFRIPDGFSIEGSMNIWSGGPETIPEGTRFGGGLRLRSATLRTIGAGVSVGSDLHLEGTGVERLPDGLSVGGSLEIVEPGLAEIGEDVKVGRKLVVKASSLEALPDGLTVGQDLEIFHASAIASLGRRTRIGGALAIPGSEIEELPDDLVAAGPLCLAEDMDLAPLPAGIRDGGVVLYSRPKDRMGPKARAPGF